MTNAAQPRKRKLIRYAGADDDASTRELEQWYREHPEDDPAAKPKPRGRKRSGAGGQFDGLPAQYDGW